MFTLLKNDTNLSFTITKENSSFGDDTKILFWIDLELQALQRGRQEYIPIDTIDRFEFEHEGGKLQAVMGTSIMVLYENKNEDTAAMKAAVSQLNSFCNL